MNLINDSATTAREVLNNLKQASFQMAETNKHDSNNFVLLNVVDDSQGAAPILVADFLMALMSKTIIKHRESPSDAINTVISAIAHSIEDLNVNVIGIAFYLNGHLNIISESNNGVRLAQLIKVDISGPTIKELTSRDIRPPEGKGQFFPETQGKLDVDLENESGIFKKIIQAVFKNEQIQAKDSSEKQEQNITYH